jgi:hypothetical protein
LLSRIGVLGALLRFRMSNIFTPHRVQKYSLRSNAPIPGTVTDSWLNFTGVKLLLIEDVWNSSETRGTYLDGKIMNRVALYGAVDSACAGRVGWFQTLHRRHDSATVTYGRS